MFAELYYEKKIIMMKHKKIITYLSKTLVKNRDTKVYLNAKKNTSLCTSDQPCPTGKILELLYRIHLSFNQL